MILLSASASDVFTYSAAGQLATASNQNISYTFGYDSVGRLQSQTDGFGNAVTYTYDTAGRKTSSTTNGSHAVAYGYSNGNLSSITSNLAGAFGFGYDTLGRRSSLTYPNGIVGTYSYNADQPSWLAGISYQGALPIYSVSYPTFDKVGNRTSKNDGTAISYGYDAVYRLLTAAGESFTYDDAGNRLTDAARLYTVTAGNVLAAAGADAFTYDSFGNTTGKNGWIYSWDSAGQLVGASNGTTAASYAYDPFGRRISKTVNGATTSYVYDGQDIAATASAGATTYFVHGPGTDEHLAATAAGQVSFYHSDGLGSITRITDAAQAVVGPTSYDSFGNAATTGIAQPYGFTGRELDTETGLMFYRARYYDPTTGRFISRDPLGLAAGDVVTSNYVGGNPANYTDPLGLELINTDEGRRIADIAKTWQGTPYYTGGGAMSSRKKADCSGATWQIYKESGFPYNYSASSSIPSNSRFKPAPQNIPQAGDIGQWNGHVLIYDPAAGMAMLNNGDSIAANAWLARNNSNPFGPVPVRWFEKTYGKQVKWYRYDKP